MATTKKTATSTSPTSTPIAPEVSTQDTSELESRVQALEEKVIDLIRRLEKKMSF